MTCSLRIKICGITRVEDALAAARLGADAVGLNFHPASPRCVPTETAQEILQRLPPFIEPVGVFTDVVRMQLVADGFGLRTLQWHGAPAELTLTPPSVDTHRSCLIVAFAVPDRDSLERIPGVLDLARGLGWAPRAVLIDGFQPGLLGGTGQTAPWELLADYRPDVPLILAGGLTPENVAEAVRIVRPYGVDVASGVESSPGVKDVDKMKRFLDNARSAV